MKPSRRTPATLASAVAVVLALAGCGSGSSDGAEAGGTPTATETPSASPTPTPGALADELSAPAGTGAFMGEPCTVDRVPVTIDASLFEEADGTACVGDTIVTMNGLELTLAWEGVQTLAEDGEEIMSDEPLPHACLLYTSPSPRDRG